MIPNDTSVFGIDKSLPSPDSHDGEREGNLLHANVPIAKGSIKYNATEDFSKHNKDFEGRDAINYTGILLTGKELVDKGSVKVKNQSVPTEYTVCTNRVHSLYQPSTQHVPTMYSMYLGVPHRQQYISLIKYLGSREET